MPDDRPTVPDLDVTLPARSESVRAARCAVDALTSWCPPDVRRTAMLLTSELASNAVLHAGTPFTVHASVHDDIIRVAVSDTGRGRNRPTRRAGGPTPTGGWGLRMVEGGSTRWGVQAGSHRTTVWFELDLHAGS